MDEKTSLQKSHSKVSNFKLTMICFLASLSVSLLWLGLAFIGKDEVDTWISIFILAAGAISTVINIYLLNRFTR